MNAAKMRQKPAARPLNGKGAPKKKVGLVALGHTSREFEDETDFGDSDFAVRRSDSAPPPRVIEVDRPHWSWVPIRYGPFHYQSASRPFRTRRLAPLEIDEFVRTNVKSPIITKCTVDRSSHCFVISYCDDEADAALSYVSPHEVREVFGPLDGDTNAGCRTLVEQIESVWMKMEQRFRSALGYGDCRLLARCGSPHAQQFTELSAETFAQYRIVDWRHGIAEDKITHENRIYALHVDAMRPASTQYSVIKNLEGGALEQKLDAETLRVTKGVRTEARQDGILKGPSSFSVEKQKIDRILKKLGARKQCVARYFYTNQQLARLSTQVTSALCEKLRTDIFGAERHSKLSFPTVRAGRDIAIKLRDMELSRKARHYLRLNGFY